MRVVQKYEIYKTHYKLRIRTGMVESYFLVHINSEGELVKFREIFEPLQMKDAQKEKWSNVFEEIQIYQFNKVFPYGTTRREKLNFLYGSKKANEMLKYEHWLDTQTYLPKEVAWKIYEQIGNFKKVHIQAKTKNNIIVRIDDKWWVSINRRNQLCYIYHNKKDKYNEQIRNLSMKLEIPLEFAAIVRYVENKRKINILKKLMQLDSNKKLMEHIHSYIKYMNESKSKEASIEYKEISKFLEKEFGTNTYYLLEIQGENFFSWAKYLNSK